MSYDRDRPRGSSGGAQPFSVVCAGPNWTAFDKAVRDEAPALYGLAGRELRARVKLKPCAREPVQGVLPVEGGKRQAVTHSAASTALTTTSTDLESVSDDVKILHSLIASYEKNSGWLWLTLKVSQTPAWKIDVELDPRSAPILDAQDPLLLYNLCKTMSKEKTHDNVESLHNKLKAVRAGGGETVNVFRTRYNRHLHAYEHGAGKALTDPEQAHILNTLDMLPSTRSPKVQAILLVSAKSREQWTEWRVKGIEGREQGVEGSRAVEQSSSRAAEQQGSRAAEQQGSRAAEQQSSRAAAEQQKRVAESRRE
jgi:hypothetical protein